MPQTTFIQDLLWYFDPLVLFACAFGLYRSGRVRHFPFFFSYLIFVAITNYATKAVSLHWGIKSYPYFYSWIAQTAVSIGLAFVVLYEVVQNVLTSGTLKINRSSFMLLTACFLLAGTALSFTFNDASDLAIMKALYIGENVTRFDQTSLLVVLAIVSVFFGFYWGDLAFGIAAGFGIYASMEIASNYIRGYLGPVWNHFTSLLSQWAYFLATLMWLFYIWKKPKLPTQSLPSDKVSEYSEPIQRLIK